jgi:phosphate transport system substrate-binding protein
MRTKWQLWVSLFALVALLAAACGGGGESGASGGEETEGGSGESDGGSGGGGEVSGTVAIDGSSTVGPLTSAVAEEYQKKQPGVTVNVGVSGTGGGFERFCGTGDTDINDASRMIKEEEAKQCEENGISYTRFQVAIDALTMVVNKENDWASCLNDEQVSQIWGEGRATNWSDVQGFSEDQEITVFAAASSSGTYDFFNETVGVETPTQDYSATENDNDIVRGVRGSTGGWGYFGFAFFSENKDSVKALEYDAGEGCVAPSAENAKSGDYKLTRPLFIYVKNSSLEEKEQVRDFVNFYLNTVNNVVSDVGYIQAPDAELEEAKSKLSGGGSGSSAESGSGSTETEASGSTETEGSGSTETEGSGATETESG